MRHELKEVDETTKTAYCTAHKERVFIEVRRRYVDGRINWRCKRLQQHSYRKYKKTYCEKCGFTGHRCQLDVDHIDGNHNNNDIGNLQTLCANCHRLKTWVIKGKNL